MNIIEIKNLTRIYNSADGRTLRCRQVLFESLYLSVAAGEFVAVVGPSGSGKTTLLNTIGGLDSIKGKGKIKLFDKNSEKKHFIPESEGSGEVFICNKDITMLRGNRKAGFINKNIGFIFQFHHLIPELTALYNVALPMLIGGKSKRKAFKRATEILEEMGLAHGLHKKPPILSGGEKQRVAIARALINNPRIVLADEPTGNLHPALKNEIMALFAKLNKERNVTILLVTHDKSSLYDEAQNLIVDRFFKLPRERKALVG
ncbi:MAG: ABC transporter ATP-binding protein [bacterium]|nr:ABC transporter ATP-binding protein [bacterium]